MSSPFQTPGSLTPVASTPTPFSPQGTPVVSVTRIPSITLPRSANIPQVSMTQTTQPEVSSAPPILSRMAPATISEEEQPQTPSVTPSVQLPSVTPSVQLPSVTPSVQLTQGPPTIPGVPSEPVMPRRSRRVRRSRMSISRLGTVNTVVPIFLSDGQNGPLNWLRPNPPEPDIENSTYNRVGCIGDGSCFFHAISKATSPEYQLSYQNFSTISEETLRRFEVTVQIVQGIRAPLFPNRLFDRNRVQGGQYNVIDPRGLYNALETYRHLYVQALRIAFANLILQDDRMDGIIRNRLHGSINMIADELATKYQASVESVYDDAVRLLKQQLANQLLSLEAVQPDFMLLLSDNLDVDIYLLRDIDLLDPVGQNVPLYGGSSLHEPVYGPSDMRSSTDPHQNMPDRRAIVLISVNDHHYDVVGRITETTRQDGTLDRQLIVNFDQDEPLIKRLFEILREFR